LRDLRERTNQSTLVTGIFVEDDGALGAGEPAATLAEVVVHHGRDVLDPPARRRGHARHGPCAFTPAQTLGEQVHSEEDRGAVRRDRRAERAIPGARKRVVERGAQIVDLGGVAREPVGRNGRIEFSVGAFGERRHIGRVQIGRAHVFAGGVELVVRVRARRLEQPVTRRVVVRLRRDERLVDERLQQIEDVEFIAPVDRTDRRRTVERKAIDEHAQAPEECALPLVEEIVAPVDERVERLLPGHRVAAAAGEHAEAFVEPVVQLLGAQQLHACRREFERERDAVEPAADIRDRRRVRVGQRETPIGGRRTIGEERHGGIRACLGRCEPRARPRRRE
jgi:hypothetical protein